MGFSVGSYAKIKEVESRGYCTKGKIVISKRVKDSNPAQYVCTFAGWVTFVGKAHQNRPMEGQKIKITNCDVTNGYLDKNTGEQKFMNSSQFTIYEYELDGEAGQPRVSVPQGNSYNPYGGNSAGFEPISLDDDSSLPF